MTNESLNLALLCVFCTLVPFAILCCIEEFLLDHEKRRLFKETRERLSKK